MGTIRSVAAGAIVLLCGCSKTGDNVGATDAGAELRTDARSHAGEPTSGETANGDSSRTKEPQGDGGASGGDAGMYTSSIDPSSQTPGVDSHIGVSTDFTGEPWLAPDSGSDLESVSNDPEGRTDAGTSGRPACRETAGLCDPVGECALDECDFERTGKSCSYTPERIYPFMCVGTANFEPYRPCDSDDVCAPGSVCISKVAILKDGSFYRRPGAVCRQTCRLDVDCGDDEWCAQATDDNNEPIPDLRVCHRHCETEADCYEGEGDSEVRCSNSVEGAPPSTYECSRYRPPADTLVADETTVATNEVTPSSGLMTWLTVRAVALQAVGEGCVFIDDCSEGEDCIEGTCRERCVNSADCDGTECVGVNGRGVCGATCEKAPGAECGIVPSNCGCRSGQTCQLDSTLTPKCADPGGNRSMTWCNTSRDCDSGLSCIGGLCRPLCDPGTHVCAASAGECLLSVSRDGEDIYACGGSCDPVTPGAGTDTGCGRGAVCLPGFDAKHHNQALCAAERPGRAPHAHGESCNEDYDCAPGLGCDDNRSCQEWCRTDDDCPPNHACAFSTTSRGILPRFGWSAEDLVGLCRVHR